MEAKFGDFIEQWSIAALKFFKENLYMNFGLIAVFMQVALENTKSVQYCVWLQIHMFSCFLKMAQVYLLLAGCRVYKGHLQNEWVIKTVREPPKENLSALNPALNPAQSMHNLYAFCRNSKISRYDKVKSMCKICVKMFLQ